MEGSSGRRITDWPIMTWEWHEPRESESTRPVLPVFTASMSSSTRKPEDLPLDNIPNLESDPRSAQESVLFSDDLISEIFEYLTIDPRFVQSGFDPENYKKLRETRGHLLGVALVCRSFREPALDLLWRSMESIIPLLKLLPRNNLELSNGQYVRFLLIFCKFSRGVMTRDRLYMDGYHKHFLLVRSTDMRQESGFLFIIQPCMSRTATPFMRGYRCLRSQYRRAPISSPA